MVLKADGLAAGKGVVIAHDRGGGRSGARRRCKGRLVIEEFLRGEEVSFIALCDGRDALPLAATQDHKAVFDGDQGPNTGGMGAYCDAGILSERGHADGDGPRDLSDRRGDEVHRLPLRGPDDDGGRVRRCWSSTCGWAIRRRSR